MNCTLPVVPDPGREADMGSYLESIKRDLGAQVRVRPLSAQQVQAQEDANWAQHDAEVQQRYRGEFVVAYQRKIVAHGHDAAAVLQAAACATALPPNQLPLIGIVDPLLDLPS